MKFCERLELLQRLTYHFLLCPGTRNSVTHRGFTDLHINDRLSAHLLNVSSSPVLSVRRASGGKRRLNQVGSSRSFEFCGNGADLCCVQLSLRSRLLHFKPFLHVVAPTHGTSSVSRIFVRIQCAGANLLRFKRDSFFANSPRSSIYVHREGSRL